MYFDTSLLDVLHVHGLQAVRRQPWLVVKNTTRTQGWKIHLTAVPVEAIALLEVVIPILKQADVAFKLAESQTALIRLNDGSFGATQIGKFITIYPETDDIACALTLQILAATEGFNGPQITSDLWLGGIVYARFGAFNPILHRNRLGQLERKIVSDDGVLINDSYATPSRKSKSPLMQLVKDYSAAASLTTTKGLFGPGYLLTDVLQAHAKGSVFRAVDLRNPKTLAGVVIKEGRFKCCSDAYGRDITDRLQHQFQLHNTLSGIVPTPKAMDCFEVHNNRYLVIEYVSGKDFSADIGVPWLDRTHEQKRIVLGRFTRVARSLLSLHDCGLVHRDLKPSNIRIDADEKVWLLDLELAHAIDAKNVPFLQGTPGYMSPQQEKGKHPCFADDVYSFGCCLFHVLSGVHPQALPALLAKESQEAIQSQLQSVPLQLVALISLCCAARPIDRPTTGQLLQILIDICDGFTAVEDSQIAKRRHRVSKAEIEKSLLECSASLADDMLVDPASGLWLSHSLDNPGTTEVLISANRGVAGGVYASSRMIKAGFATQKLRSRAETATRFLLADAETSDSAMPGLHFGQAGVAVALTEAIHTGLVDDSPKVRQRISKALNHPLDWPDVTHGAAGQGIAALQCASMLNNRTFLIEARRCADYLVSRQEADGSWVMPAGVDGMSGYTYYGFAHGLAGIIYFLAACSTRLGESAYEAAARRGTDCLTRGAIFSGDLTVVNWPWGPRNPAMWNWWCHGSVGISLAYLAMFELTQEKSFADIATRALESIPAHLRSLSVGQCHGLAGIGEVYLEARRVLKSSKWREKAFDVAHQIILLSNHSESGCTWSVDDSKQPTADLMVGNAGVCHFLLRMSHHGSTNSFPLLLPHV